MTVALTWFLTSPDQPATRPPTPPTSPSTVTASTGPTPKPSPTWQPTSTTTPTEHHHPVSAELADTTTGAGKRTRLGTDRATVRDPVRQSEPA